jgi:F-box/LRR-repeat protein|nr:MAG TPA: hypothetical protein [Caudoviricetes sp.]
MSNENQNNLINKEDLIKKAKENIDYNNSLVEDDAAVAMLGISRIVNLKNEIEELKVFIKVLNRLA